MARSVVGRGRKHLIEYDDVLQANVGTFGVADLHYHDGGAWLPVDVSLTDDGADGFAKRCDKTAHTLRIGSGGTRRWYPRRNVLTEYVDITAIEYWRTAGGGSWRNLALPAAVWKANGADWDLANVHATLTNTWNRVKADFILKDTSAPTRLRFAVALVGLTLGADWKVRSTADSADVGSIDPPVAWDANGASVPVSAVHSGGYIEWSANVAGATFPVTVDPTFTDGPSGDADTAYDTRLEQGNPTTNYGAQNALILRGNSGYITTALLKYTLTALAGATITSATQYFYRANAAFGVTTNAIDIYRILSGNAGWTEAGATYNTIDGSTAWAGGWGGCLRGGDGYDHATASMGVVSAVDNDAIGTEMVTTLDTTEFGAMVAANYGIVVISSYNGDTVQLCSSDHITTGYHPKLVVVYTTGPAGITLTAQQSGANVALSWT